MEHADAEMKAHYDQGNERDRLAAPKGVLEFVRTQEIVLRRLPAAPAVVADIGGGPGRYAVWLAELGYEVEHRDVMDLHVEQLQMSGHPLVRTAVGDARSLDLPDSSVDAVLLLDVAREHDEGDELGDADEKRRHVGGPYIPSQHQPHVIHLGHSCP